MKNEEYVIHIDASWNDKFGQKSFGSYIVYKNDIKIKEGTRKFNKRNYGSPEYDNFNWVATIIYLDYYNENKSQTFIFKSDCSGLCRKINKFNKQIKNKVQFYFSEKTNPFYITLLNTVKKYNNNIIMEWIPREQNLEADLLAVNAFNNWLIKQHMMNAKEYMLSDLKYTLMKWKTHFDKRYIEARKITTEFEDFINRLENKSE